jgi:hexosaminidase
LFKEGEQVGHGTRRNFTRVEPIRNLALGKPVISSVSSGSPFSVERVTDGGVENLGFYLGYPAGPNPVEITIDLESSQSISRVFVVAYTIGNSFEKYSVEVSEDGTTFEEVASRLKRPEEASGTVEHEFSPRNVRYVRIKSFGNKGYVFDSFSKIVEVQVFGL